MSLNELSDVEINQYFNSNPYYGGCFSKNQTSKLKDGKFYIMNMDRPSGSGTHWVLLYLVDPDVGIYFDSFGSPCSEDTLMILQRLRDVSIRNLNQVQAINASSCGYWCIYVVDNLLRHIPFHIIMSGFKGNLNKNESFLKSYFKR